MNVAVFSTMGARTGVYRRGAEADGLNKVADALQSSSVSKKFAGTQMAVKISKSAELRQSENEQAQQQHETEQEAIATMIEPHPRGLPQETGSVTYPAPDSYEGVPLDEYRGISTIPWFYRTAVQVDAEKEYARISLYACNRKFYWSIDAEALESRVLLDFIVVDDIDLSYYGSADCGCEVDE